MQDFDYLLDEPISIRYLDADTDNMVDNKTEHLFKIFLVLSGEAGFTLNGAFRRVPAGSMILASNLESCELCGTGEDFKGYGIFLTNSFCLDYLSDPVLFAMLTQRPEGFPHVVRLLGESSEKMERWAEDLMDECDIRDSFWLNQSASILSKILIHLYRHDNNLMPWNPHTKIFRGILAIQKHILRHYRESITLDGMSLEYAISKFHLSRQYKEITGFQFKDYLILLRLNEAKMLLRNTCLPISAVGTLSGYANVNHFIRIFKQLELCSPSLYRKKCRNLSYNHIAGLDIYNRTLGA